MADTTPKSKGPAETIETAPAAVATAEERRAAVAHEYGQYVALGPIDVDGVRAYNAGDPVPAANVEAHGYLKEKLVRKVQVSSE